MILGALRDLGVPQDFMEQQLAKLDLEPFEIVSSVGERAHLRGIHVQIKPKLKPLKERSFKEIRDLIEKSGLEDRTKEASIAVFRRLAEAEGKIHQEKPESVHFHEVGALDSIVDIVTALIGLDYLEVGRVCASRIPLGRGMVESRHGMLPIPAPATVELLKGVPVYDSNVEAELVTPTGAAWITTVADRFGKLPDMEIETVGYGVGDRDLGPIPNLLRVFLGRARPSLAQDQVLVVETDIDDMNPEFFEPLMDKLFTRGALDVSFVAIQRKKNRPGVTVRTICEESSRADIVATILQESTSIGVRYFAVHREKLGRQIQWVQLPYGSVRVKVSQDRAGMIHHVSPEYEDCRRLGLETNTPIMDVYQEALLAARKSGK
jgi:hypothetical protein